jgi:1-acyl-sn-glycerol-3-phosphate acyltransferase
LTGPGPLRLALYRIHFVAAAFLGGLAFLGISFFGLLYLAVTRDRKTAAHFAHAFSFIVRTLMGWKIEIESHERLDTGHPVVIMNRHQSNLDVVTLGVFYPFQTVILGKKEIRKIPLFGWFFGATGNIFVDRRNARRAIESLREASKRILEEGLSLWVFPEGTRNATRTLGPFKKGAFHVAINAQIPVLPIASGPLDQLLDGKRWMARPGTLRIRVLPEIPSAGMTSDDVDLLVERVWEAMDEGQRALLEGARPRIGEAGPD